MPNTYPTRPGPLHLPRTSSALETTHLLIILAELRTPCHKQDNAIFFQTPVQTSTAGDCAAAFAGDEWVGWRLGQEARSAGAGGLAEELDELLLRPDVLNDWNPSMPDRTTPFNSSFPLNPSRIHRDPRPTSPPPQPLPKAYTLASTVLLTQIRLAQIVAALARRRD